MSRAQLAVAQVAVFVGGGLLAPVLHLAGHRADHTHGAGGQTIAFEAPHSRDETAKPPRPEHGAEPGSHAHADSRARPHGHPHAAPGHGHAHPSSPPPGDERSSARTDSEAQPLESGHGHGSIAHLGLALLSGAPPLALPAPEPAGLLPCAPHPRAAALFQPSFPLPRPPPATALS